MYLLNVIPFQLVTMNHVFSPPLDIKRGRSVTHGVLYSRLQSSVGTFLGSHFCLQSPVTLFSIKTYSRIITKLLFRIPYNRRISSILKWTYHLIIQSFSKLAINQVVTQFPLSDLVTSNYIVSQCPVESNNHVH